MSTTHHESRLNAAILQLEQGQHLSEEHSFHCLDDILSGHCDTDDIRTLLGLLYHSGDSVATLVGFSKALLEHARPLPIKGPFIDVCGTGGGPADRYNISTTVAFILASQGIPVAKHGNYGSRKPNGSFNFLEALEIPFDGSDEDLISQFETHHCCFLFARLFHPAMAQVAPIRKTLDHPTIFNKIGPLCNPARPPYQLIGTPSIQTAEQLSQAVQQLGTQRAMIVVGGDGSDELCVKTENIIFEVSPTHIQRQSVDCKEWGLNSEDYDKGDATQNAHLFRSVMSAQDHQHPMSAHAALNAGLAAYCMGKADTIKDGTFSALSAIQSGATWRHYTAMSTQN